MMMTRCILTAAACGCLVAAAAPEPAAADDDGAALELGRKVLAVRRAIEHPQAPGALEAVKALGLDSRHYVMVRGWLRQQLSGDTSIRDASGEKTPRAIVDRIAFLEKAIRAIDLE